MELNILLSLNLLKLGADLIFAVIMGVLFIKTMRIELFILLLGFVILSFGGALNYYNEYLMINRESENISLDNAKYIGYALIALGFIIHLRRMND